MTRISSKKRGEMAKLINQGFTQKEIAKKLSVAIRTVRRYDEQVKYFTGVLNEFATKGLLKETNGKFVLTSLGKQTCETLEELTEKAVLEFMAKAGQPVSTKEVERHLDEIDDELLAEALKAVKNSGAKASELEPYREPV